MKARFTGSQQEFDKFYQHLREQPTSSEHVTFMFEVAADSDVIKGVEQLSFSNDGNFDDDLTDENDIFHSSNREWLTAKLAEADEEINAGRIVPSSKALFDDVIARGKARLKEGSK